MLIVSQHYEAVLARAKQAFGANNDSELAKALGISRPAISQARKYKTVPFKRLVEKTIESEDDISLDWLFGIKGKKTANGGVA